MDPIGGPDAQLKRGQPSPKSTLLSKSAEGATFLIVLQVASRALTFAVNQLLLRYLSPELLGVSTQLEVYSISVLFFARESLRVAIQRQTDSTDEIQPQHEPRRTLEAKKQLAARKTQEVVNLAYLSILLGVFFVFILAWAYLRSAESTLTTPYFTHALQLYGIATFWELLAEPCFVVVQQKSEYRIRAAAESVATVLRCVVTCGSAVLAAHQEVDIGVLPFAFGQWVYGLSLLFVYYRKVWPFASANGFSLIVRRINPNDQDEFPFSYFSRPLLALGMSLFVQGIVKHILTQGDVFLISYLAPLQAQGIYALASNYGGLVARMVFQPIEESSRNYFGKLLSSVVGKPSETQMQTASKDLHSLLRFYVLISVIAVVLGPTTAPLLLNIIAGSRWMSSGAGSVLAKYCYYIPLLAVNGVTEAFISSVASESELNRQSAWMFAFSIGFAAAGYVFLQVLELGAEGLVWANCINMTLRILWSSRFIGNYLRRNGSRLNIRSVLPQASTIALGVGVIAVFAQVDKSFTDGLGDLIRSGLVSGIFIVLLGISERQYLLQCYHTIRHTA